jgi:hypothetical protein
MELELDGVRRLPVDEDVNRVEGIVKEVIYLGSEQRVLIDVGQEKRFTAIAGPDQRVDLETSVTLAFRSHDTIGLTHS